MSDYIIVNGELYHYGVLGMKWGVRRAVRKQNRRQSLEKKAAKYDLKSATASSKSDKAFSSDLDKRAKKVVMKSANYTTKAAELRKRSANATDDMKKLSMEKKAAKYQLKADKKNREANVHRRATPFDGKAEKYAKKADKYTYKASKVRNKIAGNDKYVGLMKKRVSELSDDKRVKLGETYIKNLIG